MTHLVLGSSGQIGNYLVKHLKDKGDKVYEFDITRSPTEDLRTYANSFLYHSMDASDYVHFLAFDIGGSTYLKKYQDTYQFINNNIKIMDRTFELIKYLKKPFTFASSQMSNMNHSTYGLLKAVGEKYTESLGGLVVKFWNVYGYETNEEKAHVITDFIKMAKQNKVINMRTDGEEVRQFLYGRDCAECLDILSQNYNTIDREKPLHITNFEWTSIYDVAKTIQSKLECDIVRGYLKDDIQQDKRNEPDPYILNHWTPKTKLEDGIWEISSLY
jgi:nucleoside-diphosphate-sugar epimerase